MLGLSASANAFIRHVYSFLGGAGFLLAFLGLDADTQSKLIDAVHQIGDGTSKILAGLGVLVPIVMGVYAHWTAKPAQQIAAVNALPNAQVVPVDPSQPATAPVAKLQSPVLIGLFALLLALPMGGCMWTLSNGDQVVLTPQNAIPLVIDKIKQVCAHYDANKVVDDALVSIATKAINNSSVDGAVKTVTQIATDACPMLDALIQSPSKPAAAPAAGG